MTLDVRAVEVARSEVRRPLRFVAVGMLGFCVQALALHALTTGMGLVPALAIVVAVEAAILHNFVWHEWWTWRDAAPVASRLARFARFNGVTGLTSVAGNVGMTGALVAATGWPLVAANAVAVVAVSLVNYRFLDRWVFSRPGTRPARHRSPTAARLVTGVVAAWATQLTPADAAPPTEATVAAWSRHVAAAEARIDETLSSSGPFLTIDSLPAVERRAMREAILRGEVPVVNVASEGGGRDGAEVPDGMIHHWRGWLFIPGATVQEVVRGIVEPGGARAHRQEDVLEAKVLERRPDGLRLFLKLQRRKIVTVTYNTEHAVRYRTYGPDRASSRSIATRIRELADAGTPDERERRPDEDRGFLWGMNSYWRYQAVPGGVVVEMESMTLSRDVPWGAGTIVRPLIDRVARESVLRTMTAMRARFAPSMLAAR